MALVKCPECGREISSQAKTCPQCGAPNVQPANRGNVTIWWIFAGLIAVVMLVDSAKKHLAGTEAAPVAVAAPSPPRPTETQAERDTRLELCRSKLKAAAQLKLITNMSFDGGRPKVWVGRTWDRIPIDQKSELARTAACFFNAGSSERAITYPIFDGYSGKQIATWKYTHLDVE